MSNSIDITICLQIISICVNFIIALVAIFGEKIKSLFFKTNLSLNVTSLFPDCNLTTSNIGQQFFIFRLSILNNGNIDANNVQIFINSIKKKNLDGTYSTINNILPMNLMWSYQDNKQIKSSIAQIISPGMKMYCDFISASANTNNCQLCTELSLYSYGYPSNWIYEGIYIANVVVFSSNTKSKTFDIQFEYTGVWSNNANDIIKNIDVYEV